MSLPTEVLHGPADIGHVHLGGELGGYDVQADTLVSTRRLAEQFLASQGMGLLQPAQTMLSYEKSFIYQYEIFVATSKTIDSHLNKVPRLRNHN